MDELTLRLYGDFASKDVGQNQVSGFSKVSGRPTNATNPTEEPARRKTLEMATIQTR